MRKANGDILPNVSDDCRYNIIAHKVEYYEKITRECEKCDGTGIRKIKEKEVKCSCKKSLEFILELLKSNFPPQHFDIFRNELFKRKIVEIDTSNPEVTHKPTSFNEDFMYPFLNNKLFMINNSCSSLFTGNNETGKTYGALYMLADFIKNGFSGHYIRFKNYLNLLNSSYSDKEDKTVLRQIREVKFLIVDELGKEHGKHEYATCELEELIKTRQDNLSCTLLITNLDYKDFVDTYGNHVRSAFNKNFKALLFHPDSSFRTKTRVEWPKSQKQK